MHALKGRTLTELATCTLGDIRPHDPKALFVPEGPSLPEDGRDGHLQQ